MSVMAADGNPAIRDCSDVGISAVMDIDLPEGCGLEIRVKRDGLVARLVVKMMGLAVIAGRLDGQYVVAVASHSRTAKIS